MLPFPHPTSATRLTSGLSDSRILLIFSYLLKDKGELNGLNLVLICVIVAC